MGETGVGRTVVTRQPTAPAGRGQALRRQRGRWTTPLLVLGPMAVLAGMLSGCQTVVSGGGPATPATATAGPAAATAAAVPAGGSTATDGSTGSTGISAAAAAAIAQQAAWIRSAQLADGALAPDPPAPWSTSVDILPYLGNYAAMGLARAALETGDPADGAAAWRWLQWYAANEQPGTGYVEDSRVSLAAGEPVTPLGSEDSTDAYAGTFLLAVYDTDQAAPSPTDLQALAGGIAGALHAIETTEQPDGLSWALPTYPTAYLMDMSETYAGLQAAASLEQTLGDAALAAAASDDADAMAAAVARLWDPTTGAFDWAAFPTGVTTPVDWQYLYPDAMEEAWAAAFGVATPTQAALIVGKLGTAEPQWDQPGAGQQMRDRPATQPVGYWPLAAWALERTGQVTAGEQAAATIWQQAAASEQWPFTVADAGQLIVAESGGPTLAGTVPAGS